jgi:hypothetical protein
MTLFSAAVESRRTAKGTAELVSAAGGNGIAVGLLVEVTDGTAE